MAFRHPRIGVFQRLFPDISDPDGARAATRNAAIGGFIVAGLGMALVLATQSADLGELDMGAGWWGLIDVAVGLGLAFGTLRGNRYAATGQAAFYIVTQVITRVAMGTFNGLALAVGISALFVQGARAAWALHRWSMMDADDLEAQVDALAEPEEVAA